MAALAVVDEAVMELVTAAAAVAEVMAVLLVTLVAGRGLVAMAGIAVCRAKGCGMLLVKRTHRPTLEAGVTGGALPEGFAQRPAGNAGDMAAFAVVDEAVMELVARAAAVAEVVAVLLVTLVAGWRFVTMASGAVAGAEGVGMLHVQLAKRSALEAGVASGAFPEGFAQRAPGDA